MPTVRITIVASQCRGGCHRVGESYLIDDLCPPICHELWHVIYPSVYALHNGAELDYGDHRERRFVAQCPDSGRVTVVGDVVD